jgi:hypothetical protein
VALKCARIGTSSMTFAGAIFRGDELLITCELVYVFADPASQTSKPVPDALRRVLTGYEAGEAMLHIKAGDWAALGADAGKVRTAVFVRGAGHPHGDGMGRGRQHGPACRGLQRPGAGHCHGAAGPHAEGVGKIGRMAVHRALRGSRVGADILNA